MYKNWMNENNIEEKSDLLATHTFVRNNFNRLIINIISKNIIQQQTSNLNSISIHIKTFTAINIIR